MTTLDWRDLSFGGAPALLRALETLQAALGVVEGRQMIMAGRVTDLADRMCTLEVLMADSIQVR